MSHRKPFNDRAGYVASRKNPLTNIHNVIYVAADAGIDASDKYVTVCEAHSEMVSSTSVPKARIDMKDASQWCSSCQELAASHQIYGLLDGAIPRPAEELEEALLGNGKKTEWTEEQLKNLNHFSRMLWNK